MYEAMDRVAYWYSVSGLAQRLIAGMLTDEDFFEGFLKSLREKLWSSYSAVTAMLTEANIPFVRANAGMFVFVDLSQFLPERTPKAEMTLWRSLLEKTNVNVTPGQACLCPEPGWFRICYASEPKQKLVLGIQRILDVLNK
eukprot:TRINITY_DN5637_c0_g1_i1.p1 TRINITY_DN5637_c0_g1~~TRINITY_DN5637_c0_g1_i1.p1  ORF type:complete len:141 (+),score=13.11 TRINITY_DN5637_c0_g1_i1:634-1056(+)